MSKSDLYQFVARFGQAMPWRSRGLCRKAGDRSKWFICDEDDTVEWNGKTINGRRAQLLAVEKYCSECDVQWDCALWAVRNEEPQGVWGMTIRDLLWLQRFGGGDLVVESAKFMDEPVQVFVRRTRRCVNRAEVEAEEREDSVISQL
jgi:hypothetical protein